MALPNPSMSFSPFAILTAEEMNELVENIEALADGSGIDSGAIIGSKFKDGTLFPDAANASTVTISSGALSNSLVYTAPDDGFFSLSTFDLTAGNSFARYYSTSGPFISRIDTVSISGTLTPRQWAFTAPIGKGMTIYMTKTSSGTVSAWFIPAKKS